MKIKDIQTKIVNAEMRNWVFVKVITDSDIYGWGEATVEWKTRAVAGAIEDLKPLNSKIVGDKHIKAVLIGPEGTSLKTIAFNATDNELGVYLLKKNNNSFNIAGKLSLNEWRGQKNVEFIIDDISVNKNMKN